MGASMSRRDRLIHTLNGEPVDRPPVCFYEINGYDEHPQDTDPANIYSHPTWKPLIDLARDKTDRIIMRSVPFKGASPDPLDAFTHVETYDCGDRWISIKTIRIGNHILTERTRRDRDVNTIWTEEHLLKGHDDLTAYLSLPAPKYSGMPDISTVQQVEADLGDTGIVMIDTSDPLCQAAALFSMADFTVIALTEPALFNRLLERFASILLPQTEAVARALPGRLWRIYGPEYASPPYLPPRLFREYVVRYDTPMIDAIQRYQGFARIHCHGRINLILDEIASTGCTGLDPIEPPPQGDIELADVRKRYGQQMVLFGNLEASDLETLPTQDFAQKIRRALGEGTAGTGRGFVLMPSACPYGRYLPSIAMQNYEKMVELVENF
jgi:hypothetical protein